MSVSTIGTNYLRLLLQTLKGVGGKVIILEEASRLDPQVWMEVIVPLLGVAGTSVLAISTPLDENNWYSKALEATRPNGETIFKTIEVHLFCERCLREQRHKRGLDCPHNASVRPPWKSGQRHELVKSLMASNKDMWLREQTGVVTKSESCAFSKEGLDKLSHRPAKFLQTHEVEHVFVAIDPAGGGRSGMAIVSGVYESKENLCIIGADTCDVTSDEDMEKCLSAHFGRIRNDRNFSTLPLVLIIEANYGGWVSASRVYNICQAFSPVRCMVSTHQGVKKPGVWLTNSIKERMRVDFNRLLRTDKICFYVNFTSSDQDTRDQILQQLQNYKIVWKENESVFTRNTAVFSGKGFQQNDDLAVCVQYLAYHPSVYYSDETKVIKA